MFDHIEMMMAHLLDLHILLGMDELMLVRQIFACQHQVPMSSLEDQLLKDRLKYIVILVYVTSVAICTKMFLFTLCRDTILPNGLAPLKTSLKCFRSIPGNDLI